MIIVTLPVVTPPPPPPPPPPPNDPGPITVPGAFGDVQTESLSWTWTAPWLGRAFRLTGPNSPVVKLRGATGLGRVDPLHFWAEPPSLDGDSWEGARVGRGQVFLPLMVTGRDSADFLVQNRSFKQTLNHRQEGVLRVTAPDGTWREIACRYESGADSPIDLDPVKACRAIYGITWATADPFWQGEELVYRFTNGNQGSFFPGPPFVLGPGLSLNDPTIVNPGDAESHAVWRVEGPFTGFSVGVGGSLVVLDLDKNAGQWVEIDMRPGRRTIVDEAGVNQWPSVTNVAFATIPPGTTTLTTSMANAGTASAVTLTITPRYDEAF